MKIFELVAAAENLQPVQGLAEKHDVLDIWWGVQDEKGRISVRLLVDPKGSQELMDALHGLLGPHGHLIVTNVEAVLPRQEEKEEEEPRKSSIDTTREELYDSIEKGAHLDSNFVLLVILSTLVAAIGIIEDNVAVVIGAMVIAPLLGSNIALALATALGDTELMWKSLRTSLIGIILAVGISVVIGKLWPVGLFSNELLARTDVGLDGVALALASGAAAALSLTTGLSSVLVGVMVAVALLPPAAVLGLMIGSGQWQYVVGAGLLLAVNVVCVNLSAKLVFLIKGIKPRTWLSMEKARQSMLLYILFWGISLVVLLLVIAFRSKMPLS